MYDLPSFALISMAAGTVYYGCICARRLWQSARADPVLRDAIQTVSLQDAVLFPVLASVVLVVLFYVAGVRQVFLFLSFFSAVSSIAFCIDLPMSVAWPSFWQQQLKQPLTVPGLGIVSQRHVVGCAFGALTWICWLWTGHWMLNNVIGIAVSASAISFLRVSSGKVAVVLYSLLFFYDIYWVFYSQNQFGESVMVSVATKIDMPVKLEYPRYAADGTLRMSMLGLGDIAVPGLLVAWAHRLGTPYFRLLMAGYVCGLVAAMTALFEFHAAQPALLYIVPCTMIPLFWLAWARGELSLIWGGSESMGSGVSSPRTASPDLFNYKSDQGEGTSGLADRPSSMMPAVSRSSSASLLLPVETAPKSMGGMPVSGPSSV